MSESVQMDTFHGYEVRREMWQIAGRSFDLTWPSNMDVLLDLPRTRDRFEKDEYMPYWAQPWPSAVLLVEAILGGEPGDGRRAVEIGCGIGLVSVAAAMMGWRVTASDYDADAVAFAVLNAARSGVHLEGAATLDYRVRPERPAYDSVLGADLLYERRLSRPVASWIASALHPGGVALLSDSNRSAADDFPDCADSAGLAVEECPVETTGPSGLVIRGRIWRLWHRPASLL